MFQQIISDINRFVWSATISGREFMMIILILEIVFALIMTYVVFEIVDHKILKLKLANEDLEEELSDVCKENERLKNMIISMDESRQIPFEFVTTSRY